MIKTLPINIPLPVGSSGRRSSGWWGIMTLIVTEASLFAYLLFSYFYLASQTEQPWPPDGLPALMIPGLNTLILLTSSVCVWTCELCLQRRDKSRSLTSMALAVVLGICFVVIQLNEWHKRNSDMSADLYDSLYFTITGFHLLHVLIGLYILLVLWLWIALGYFDDQHYVAVSIGGLYWHFVDVVWLFVFTSLYLTPYLLV